MENGKDEQMRVKLLGALLVVAASGGFGFLMASSYKRKIRLLQDLLEALDDMECELKYRSTPLPQLCRLSAKQGNGIIGRVLASLANQLDSQVSPDARRCMVAVLQDMDELDQPVRRIFEDLGENLGRFDMDGQLQGIAHAKASCRDRLASLQQNKEERLRSYQTLGLCAGAALAILFV